jgi:hypothetical protein
LVALRCAGWVASDPSPVRAARRQGYLAIDNNLSERTLRAIAVGRNNSGVLGSESGGKTAEVLYTMVATYKHLGIDPFAYLHEALLGLFALGEKPTTEQFVRGRSRPVSNGRMKTALPHFW